ncbi:MAG TPA: DUF2624 family protein [Virgibacillus sp.]|nr:DUF2624 family protein [Virgibacillus sp.]
MSGLIKEIIKKKLNHLSYEELLAQSEKFGFELTTEEAKQIISYLKRTNINPFSQHDRLIMLQALADITDQATAHQANDLFIEVIKSYGVEHLFEA